MVAAHLTILLLLLGCALGTTTKCGYSPTSSSPCEAGCSRVDPSLKVCVPSCGFSCKSDADCGSWPASACSACVSNHCSGAAEFGNCTRTNQSLPSQGIVKEAPLVPSQFNATLTYVNITDMSTGYGTIQYDYRFLGLRQEFGPICPLANLQGEAGINDTPCIIVFYKGIFAINYPQRNRCCQYSFPVWKPDVYRAANATYGGSFVIDFQTVDYWQFQYTCPWIRPLHSGQLPAVTVQRDVYFSKSGYIVRMNETLTNGYTDFFNTMVGPQDETQFRSALSNCDSVDTLGEADFLKKCIKYAGVGRLSFLGYD